LATEEHSILDQRAREALGFFFFFLHNLGVKGVVQLKVFWLKKLIHTHNTHNRQPDEAGNKRGGMPCMCILRVFPERLHGFFGKLRNCCACSFSASILSLYLVCVVLCLGAKTPVPFFLGFLCKKKKNTLSKKNRVSREDGPRFVFAYVVARFLERASTRRSLALFAERGSFRNPLGFFLCTLAFC
jgi:hypothetical protein